MLTLATHRKRGLPSATGQRRVRVDWSTDEKRLEGREADWVLRRREGRRCELTKSRGRSGLPAVTRLFTWVADRHI